MKLMEKGSEWQSEAQELLVVAHEYKIKVFHYTQFRDFLQEHFRVSRSTITTTKKRKAEDEMKATCTKKMKKSFSWQYEEKESDSSNSLTIPLVTPITIFKRKNKEIASTPPSPARLKAMQQLTSFQLPYILVEDTTKPNFLPFWHEFVKSKENPTGFPVIHFDKSNYSPFLTCPPNSEPEAIRPGADAEDRSHTEVGEGRESFCSVCKIRFPHYKEHVVCKVHTDALLQQDSIFSMIRIVLEDGNNPISIFHKKAKE